MIQTDHGAAGFAGGNSGILGRKSWFKETRAEPPFLALWVMLVMLAGSAEVFAQENPGRNGPPGTETSGTAAPRAADILRISPDEAVERAVKNNLNLESNRVTVETKKRASDTAWNVFIPSVTVGGSLIRDNQAASGTTLLPVPIPNMSPPVYGVMSYSYETPRWHIAGSIQTSLNINFAMFEAMRRLQLEYEGGLLTYEKARAQLERDVRKSYYQMLLLQENIALLQESYEAAERRVNMARANYRAGLVPELNLLQAQVSMENMKPTIDQAENGLKLAMAQFAANLGLGYDTRFELIPVEDGLDFIPLDMAELLRQASVNKPEIQELRQNILVLESSRKAVKQQTYTPNLSLSWNLNSALAGDPWKDSWFGTDWTKSGSFTLALSFQLHSLLPWSSGVQSIKNLDDNIRSLNIGLAQAVQGTELEIYNTLLSLEKTRTTVEAQEYTVNLAERSYKLTEEAYRAGLTELLEVQNAELELRKARIGISEQNFNYIQSLIDLEYSLGVPFGTLSSRAHSGENE
ncbi:MAG: TolC family protein [Treponema sp.]|jgi:outer membrane protein TolC|nr:TolC family protein [Treponema sp.]